jgi:small subunit ribosomal protein S5
VQSLFRPRDCNSQVEQLFDFFSFFGSFTPQGIMLNTTRRGILRTLQTGAAARCPQQVSSFASTSRLAQDVSEATEASSAEETKVSAEPSPPKPKKINPLQFSIDTFPSLMDQPHPILDAYDRKVSPATPNKPFASTVTIINDTKLFSPTKPSAASLILSGGNTGDEDIDSASYLATVTPFSEREINEMHHYMLKVRRITQMTGKGKNSRMAALTVAGNGRGLVGYGEGKDINVGKARQKAFHQAVKTMDQVERYDGRTIPAEVKIKWGSTQVTLRPRPAGFGLRVPPIIHAIARACGISDLSASILGSANPYNVVRATLQLLWGGSAPLGMGDGVGGSMRRKDKGAGMRTIRDIELSRGRRLREVRVD